MRGDGFWEKIRADEATRRQVNNWLRLLFNENESDDEPARYRIDVNPFVSLLQRQRGIQFLIFLKNPGISVRRISRQLL